MVFALVRELQLAGALFTREMPVATAPAFFFFLSASEQGFTDSRYRGRRSPTTEADRHVANCSLAGIASSSSLRRNVAGYGPRRFDPRLRRIHQQTPPSRRLHYSQHHRHQHRGRHKPRSPSANRISSSSKSRRRRSRSVSSSFDRLVGCSVASYLLKLRLTAYP